MREVRFIPCEDEGEDKEQTLPQFLEAFPNDLVARKILPFLDFPDLKRLPLVSKSWSALLHKGTVWSSVVCKEWFIRYYWLVMLCRTGDLTGDLPNMEFVAFPVARKNLPTSSSSGSSSSLVEEDLDCWVSLSWAIQDCLPSGSAEFKDIYGFDMPLPAPWKKEECMSLFYLDDGCLISATAGLMCIIWHPDPCQRPLRPPSGRVKLSPPPFINLTGFTPMLIDVINSDASVLEPPNAYVTFSPFDGSGRRLRNVFMSMQRDNHPRSDLTIIIHDDLLNFVEVYSYHTDSWRTVSNRMPCAVDDYPHLKVTTNRVHLGDVFAIRHLAPGAVYAYSAGFDEWSKVDVQYPVDARQLFSRAFKYADRVFLAALLMMDPRSPLAFDASHPGEFHGFGIWELKAMPSDANAYSWEQVATSEYDDEYCKSFPSLSEFDIQFMEFQGFVCMTSVSIRGRELRKIPPLVYNFASKSWFLLPECKSVMDYQCVFGF